MNKPLPEVEFRINVEEGAIATAIALVDEPAIESNYQYFSKVKPMEFAANDEKMELLGAAMIPDIRIYRNDNGREYNGWFSKQTVRSIAQNFMKNGFQSQLNLDHTSVPAGAYIFQSYIVDHSKGQLGPENLNLPEGSWVIGVKVEDKAVWADIKAGKRKGFSIEAILEMFDKQVREAYAAQSMNAGERELIQVLKEITENMVKIINRK